jgi:hypothetical protein
MSEPQLADLESFEIFENSRQLTAWLETDPARQQTYKTVLLDAQYDMEVQKAAIPLPHAVDALECLAKLGRIIYVTLRMPYSEELTRDWLARSGFPSPTQAYCCDHFHSKYIQAYSHLQEGEHLVMIDDHCRFLLRGYYRLTQQETKMATSLRRRMAFISFGSRPIDPIPHKLECFPIRRVPSWKSEAFKAFYAEVSDELAQQRNASVIW